MQSVERSGDLDCIISRHRRNGDDSAFVFRSGGRAVEIEGEALSAACGRSLGDRQRERPVRAGSLGEQVDALTGRRRNLDHNPRSLRATLTADRSNGKLACLAQRASFRHPQARFGERAIPRRIFLPERERQRGLRRQAELLAKGESALRRRVTGSARLRGATKSGRITSSAYPITLSPCSTMRRGAGHSTVTAPTLRDPAKSKRGGTPASPG